MINELKVISAIPTIVHLRHKGYPVADLCEVAGINSVSLKRFCKEWFGVTAAKFLDGIVAGKIPQLCKDKPRYDFHTVHARGFKERIERVLHARILDYDPVVLVFEDKIFVRYSNLETVHTVSLPVDFELLKNVDVAGDITLLHDSGALRYYDVIRAIKLACIK